MNNDSNPGMMYGERLNELIVEPFNIDYKPLNVKIKFYFDDSDNINSTPDILMVQSSAIKYI